MPSRYNNADYTFWHGNTLDNYVICFHFFFKIKEPIIIIIISILISEGSPSVNYPSINHGEGKVINPDWHLACSFESLTQWDGKRE